MNWKEFRVWCETAPREELYSLLYDMSDGDFRYYDNCQHDDGFYDNWRDFRRRRKYLYSQLKKRFV